MRIGRRKHRAVVVTTGIVVLIAFFAVVAEAYISHQEMVQGRKLK